MKSAWIACVLVACGAPGGTDGPPTLGPGQTNTPCIYKTSAGCRLRRSNCEHRPCTESAHEPIECGRAVPPMTTTARVCLELRGLPRDATIASHRNRL